MATIIGNAFAQTQEQTLQTQWNLGIRAFDLRPAIYKWRSTNELWLYHGVTRVSISWATAMNTIKANLTDHPGEFAIVLFRHEDESTIGKDNNTTNFNTYMTNWVNANKAWIVFSQFTPSFVRRFLISGLDLGIDARFSQFTPSFVHRFLISSPNLRIAARFSRFTPSCVHRFLISGPNLRIAAASRRCKEEWPACSGRSGDDVRVRF